MVQNMTEIETFNEHLRLLKSATYKYIETMSGSLGATDMLTADELDKLRKSVKISPEAVDKSLFQTIEKVRDLRRKLDEMIIEHNNILTSVRHEMKNLPSNVTEDVLSSFGRALEWDDCQRLRKLEKQMKFREKVVEIFDRMR